METAKAELDFKAYTILIVDDNLANLGVLFNYLDSYGFEIMVAQDGESGLEKAHYGQPDIILLDAMMPGLDGFEVCRRLKLNEVTQTIPVIFMTVLMNTEDKVKGFTVGAVDYVTKPIQPAELLARLVTHLRLRDLTRQLQMANEQLQKEIAVRQRAEQELKGYRDHLEELVKQRTAELTRANEQLQQEMTERQQAEEEIRQQSQRLRALTARLTEVEETERRRLARELHDRVGQDLGTLDINLNILRAQIPTDAPSLLHSHLNDSLELLKQVAKQVYDVMADLRSPVLDDYGLVAALNWYGAQFTTRTGLKVTVRGQETPRLPLATENALFHIAKEALSNVAKHAQATQVMVTMESDNGLRRFTIADDGIGFNLACLAAPTGRQGWGVMSMTERAEAVGGVCRIETLPQRGTQVIVEIP
jgi:signal transduction histidine kinase